MLPSPAPLCFERDQRTMLVAGNQYIHFREGDEQANLAPDVYVIPDEATPIEEVSSWRLWEHGGKGPCLAIEVVSDDPKEARKDYALQMIEKYEAMGVAELFRYDPHSRPRRRVQQRQLLTHWVRGEDESLHERPLDHPERARSAHFDFWLVCLPWPRLLRLGTGPEGTSLWPARHEWEARRAEEEARRADEAARRADEAASRADEAERRLGEALAELARLRGEK